MKYVLLVFIFILASTPAVNAGLDEEVKYLFPGAVNGKDYTLQDDSNGKGPYIKEWKWPTPKPTKGQLKAVETQAGEAAKERRKEAKFNGDSSGAIIKFLANHHGMTPQQVKDELKSYLE